MPKNTSRIGKREENQIRKDLEDRGYSARRQPGSGNRDIDLQDDVVWKDSPAGKLHIESKFKGYDKDGVSKERWKTLLTWKQGADILCVRAAGKQRYAFLSWNLLLELVGPAGVASYEEDTEVMDVPALQVAGQIADRKLDLLKEVVEKRDRIQSAYQPPKSKPPQRRNNWPNAGKRPFNKGAR